MTSFVFLSWDETAAAAAPVYDRFRSILRTLEDKWQLLIDLPGALLAVKAGGRISSGRVAGHRVVVIGDLFARHGGASTIPWSENRSFRNLCERLTTDCWGAYCALGIGDKGSFSIYRDPIGMEDAVSWCRPGLRVIASQPVPWLPLSDPPGLSIDWPRLADLLLDSSTVSEACPLTGVETIPPGVAIEYGGPRRTACRLWQPGQFYGHRDTADSASLRDTVIGCVRAWSAAYPEPVVELSGGFDSALVAVTGSGIAKGVNFFTDELAGDERRYARDVGVRAGIPVDEIHMPVGRLSMTDIEDMPVGVRPGLGSTTLFHDRLLARRAAARSGRALFTGHGGDAVFFQHPTAAIAADPTFPRADLQSHLRLAKWTRVSAWTIARHAFGIPPRRVRDGLSDGIAPLPVSGRHQDASMWAGDLSGLPPAKQEHIRGIAGERSAFGPSWRSHALTVVHPLLSQPLVELALATDTYLLTQGRRDRALAREAFRDLLPPSVNDRRGKGSLGQFFGRSLAASTDFLRPFLLDGALVEHGVLDRTRLEPMLDRDFLMQYDCYGQLLSAIVMEQWARVWTDRLQAIRSGSCVQAGAASPSVPAN
ncbi:asparagine synthase C-terminal domain-containing protein [Sphingomonas adhaesiva]|uniref:asparagine synthase C-terminal domain-containing protein n=1 Tax=Sphingomonas adhaesiva TaxID=28212 RepID=UPI002FFC12FA